jgi:DNA-binding CsgD family transcriptional regulator
MGVSDLQPRIAQLESELKLAHLKIQVLELEIESLKQVAHHETPDLTPLITKLKLTATEAELAAALFRGDSPEGYAKATHRSINTVRWTVKCIYAKTGVHRQNQLMKLLAQTLA